MKKIKLNLIGAARPNFMKIAPIFHVLKKEEWCMPIIVHTGQHYDENMSGIFFKELGMPKPKINLGVGGGTQAVQTAKIMMAYEEYCLKSRPDGIIVVGDVNSTMACALVGAKLHIPVFHVEAGIRSGDREMPEEINRLVTDAIVDKFLTPSEDANDILINEGHGKKDIWFVGNTMIDCYEMCKEKIDKKNTSNSLGMKSDEYVVVTLHRPSNVDEKKKLFEIVKILLEINKKIKIIFSVHPRTKNNLINFGLWEKIEKNIKTIEPLGYMEFMNLVSNSKFVLTDSGGIQEETTYIGIPCLTLRENTERPITVSQGTNILVNESNVLKHVNDILNGKIKSKTIPKYWDGKTAGRILQYLKKYYL